MQKVPRLDKQTGVSHDYWNEYSFKVFDLSTFGFAEAKEDFRKYPVKRYGERFPAGEYEDVVNDRNRARVSRLDDIALSARAIPDNADFTEADFKRIINEVYTLIFDYTFYDEQGNRRPETR